ncbi:MAG: nuclear transport factor 2 family protein [Alphaproteobacteria bacterium]|nr:nuclear transport factor 2 family protein [Alphaproteobacteria bacterium]
MDDEKLLKLKKPLDDYIEYYEKLTPRSVAMIEKLAVPGVRFKDPFNDVMGVDAYQRVLQHMFENVDNPKFRVSDYAWGRGANIAYLRWTFTYMMKNRQYSVEGASEVMFSDDGLVMSHIDYWDAAENFYEHLPVLGAAIRFVKSKLKVE